MADTKTTRPPRMKPWLRVLLFASLALNLAFAGIVAGTAFRHGGPDRDRSPRTDRVGVAYIRALSKDDRRAIRDAIRAELPDRDTLRSEMRASLDAILQTLRADPFDPATLAAQFEAQFLIGADIQGTARSLMLERVAAMTPEERRAFADRLEEELARAAQRGGKRGEGHSHGHDGS